jgi:hypothetical protein
MPVSNCCISSRQAQEFERGPLARGLVHFAHFQTELDIVLGGTPGKQLREVLEHDTTVLPVLVERSAADADLAGGRLQETGEDVQYRGLAAAAGAEQAEELGLADGEIDVLDRQHPTFVDLVFEGHVLDFDLIGHLVRPYLAPAAPRRLPWPASSACASSMISLKGTARLCSRADLSAA